MRCRRGTGDRPAPGSPPVMPDGAEGGPARLPRPMKPRQRAALPEPRRPWQSGTWIEPSCRRDDLHLPAIQLRPLGPVKTPMPEGGAHDVVRPGPRIGLSGAMALLSARTGCHGAGAMRLPAGTLAGLPKILRGGISIPGAARHSERRPTMPWVQVVFLSRVRTDAGASPLRQGKANRYITMQ